jgi:hypothetical protein
VIQIRRIGHTPAAVTDLLADIVRLEPDPAEVRVVLETRHGMLVERLVDTGVMVLPVNPSWSRGAAGRRRKRTTLRMPASAVRWRLTAIPACGRWCPTASSLASCAPSPATTSAPHETSAGCSTACGRTCSAPS